MPATNGRFQSGLQLSSADNGDATITLINPLAPFGPATTNNYLSVVSSGFAILKDCLSLFAVFIIARYLLRRRHSAFIPSPRLCPGKVSPSIPWRQHRIISFDATPRSTSNPALRGRNSWYPDPSHGLFPRVQGHPGPLVPAPPHPPYPPPHFFYPDMDDEHGDRDSGRLVKSHGNPKHVPAVGSAPSRRSSPILPWTGHSEPPRRLISRPPPAPPLTPPVVSTSAFTLGDLAATRSFMHQPNPDYMSSTATTMTENTSSMGKPPGITRRRSYHKTQPIGIPHRAPFHDPNTNDMAISSNSYPPTSPLLPPPPPTGPDNANEHEDGGRSDVEADSGHGATDVRGELESVLDGEGAGWTRHTRVYGGGVCLACAAAGREGGFYGVNVRPEEMR